MAASTNTIPRHRAKPFGEFMAKVLDPLPDAELADPQIAKLEKRAMRANWNANQAILSHLRRAERSAFYEISVNPSAERSRAHWDAHARWVREASRIVIHVPAPDEKAVAWKRRNAGTGSHFIGEDAYAKQDAAIAADEARLKAAYRPF